MPIKNGLVGIFFIAVFMLHKTCNAIKLGLSKYESCIFVLPIVPCSDLTWFMAII